MNREFRLIDDECREAYRNHLRRACKTHPGTSLLAYALMSSHTHQLAQKAEGPLGPFLHSANTAYGRWYNQRTGGLGRVFAERPSSDPVDGEESLAKAVAYLHNNPPRAGVVTCPSESDWTTHRAFIGMVPAPGFVNVEWTLAAMGFSSSSSGRLSFHKYVCSRTHLARDPSIAGPGPSSVASARGLLLAFAAFWGLDPLSIANPGRCPDLGSKRTELVVFGRSVLSLQVGHLAEALGISPTVVSRMGREPRLSSKRAAEMLNIFLEAGTC